MLLVVQTIGICALLSVMITGANAGDVPREPLDQLWEEHMLLGTHADYLSGKPSNFVPHEAPEAAMGSPGSASLTTRGICIQDFRGTELLGLRRGGGWALLGGLLGAVPGPDGLLELYGKEVAHFYPSFLEIFPYSKPREEETYEFFLLVRKEGEQRATLIKKWVIEPHEIKWFVYPAVREMVTKTFPGDEKLLQQQETRDVRGFLKYDPTTQEAEVTITGLIHPWSQRVKVP